MISQETIENVLQAADIVQVASGAGLALKKQGANMVVNCCFHNEKSSSLTFSPVRQMYKCFGCGAGGNAINFIKNYKGVSFTEAVKQLAADYNIDVKEDGKKLTEEEKTELTNAYQMMADAKLFYHKQLLDNKEAMAYLLDRGYTTETIALWQLGYSPNTSPIKQKAIKDGKWDLALKVGLCAEGKEGKNYDCFFSRIMIPIHDESGRVISFGARIWTKEQAERKEPKYINGKTTFIYHKEQVLFGFERARMIINNLKEAIVCEGYFDVIMAHQYNINYAVATCGTALGKHHAERLLKIAKNITLGGDGDSRGIESTLKNIDTFYQYGATQVDVLEFPEGIKDMDEFLKQI